MDDLFYYYINDGPFHSRQHIINHVDMILGLTRNEKELSSQNKIIVLFDRAEKKYLPITSSELDDNEMAELRKKIILDSFYANKWIQFTLAERENGAPIQSSSLTSVEEIDELLNLAFDLWEEQEKGWEEFINKTSVVVVLLNWESPVIDRIVIDRLPSKDEINRLPLAISTRHTLAAKYSSNDGWEIYTNRICQNSFMKEHLKAVQNSICPVCNCRLEKNAVIHHVDYDHSCTFCNSGLEWRKPKMRVQPNCELCFNDHREWFDICASYLQLLHNHCHFYIDRLL